MPVYEQSLTRDLCGRNFLKNTTCTPRALGQCPRVHKSVGSQVQGLVVDIGVVPFLELGAQSGAVEGTEFVCVICRIMKFWWYAGPDQSLPWSWFVVLGEGSEW